MQAPAPALWRVEIAVPAEIAEPFREALEAVVGNAASYQDEGADVARVAAWPSAAPEPKALKAALAAAAARAGAAVPEARVERLPPTDWLAENRSSFPTTRAGRFFIAGTVDTSASPAGAIVLRLDAGPAFGSGTHATTRGSLLALDGLARRRRVRRALDLGCGSGILALAMAAAWRAAVLAVDIEPVAAATTRDNARRNGLGPLVRAITADGPEATSVRRAGPFDLIAANILAPPLARMAPGLARLLAPGGAVVLSGLLAHEEAGLRVAYRAHGLVPVSRIRLGDWVTLALSDRGF